MQPKKNNFKGTEMEGVSAVCPLVFSATVYQIVFTLGRCTAEDRRKCIVECELLNSTGHIDQQCYYHQKYNVQCTESGPLLTGRSQNALVQRPLHRSLEYIHGQMKKERPEMLHCRKLCNLSNAIFCSLKQPAIVEPQGRDKEAGRGDGQGIKSRTLAFVSSRKPSSTIRFFLTTVCAQFSVYPTNRGKIIC